MWTNIFTRYVYNKIFTHECIACKDVNLALSCFLVCEADLLDYEKDGKLQICKSYADAYYVQCGDALVCTNNTLPCGTDPDSSEGCQKLSEFYASGAEFLEKTNQGIVVESGLCFSGAGNVIVSFAAIVFVAIIGMLSLV